MSWFETIVLAFLASVTVLSFFVHATLLRIMHALERISGHQNRVGTQLARVAAELARARR